GRSAGAPAGGRGGGRVYSARWPAHIPAGTSGTYFVLVKADHGSGFGAVYENNDTAPNVASSTPAFPVAAQAYADLVSAITVSPSTGQIGQTIDLAWQVTNASPNAVAATGAGPWSDRAVLSGDNVYGNADDISLGEFAHTGVVAVGASYTAAKTVTIPSNFYGDGYLFVVADSHNNIYEYTFEGNNASAARPIAVQAPDL